LKNFSDYKRCFTFGCSITRYRWPTWSDIIKQEIPSTYNFAQSGAGNLFIANSITEANLRYEFNKDDLVIVMWSSISREDRYLDNTWITPGNITSQNFYSAEWVDKWYDARFYLLRDLALIESTRQAMKAINTNFHMWTMTKLPIVPADQYKQSKPDTDIQELYKHTIADLKPSIVDTIYHGQWPVTPIKGHGKHSQTADYHPTPKGHVKYIEKMLPTHRVTSNMTAYAHQSEMKVREAKSFKDLETWWNEHNNKQSRL